MNTFRAAGKPLPSAFDATRAARTLEALAGKGFVPSAQQAALLTSAFGNSPYLARLALRESEYLEPLLELGAHHWVAELCREVCAVEHAETIDVAMTLLRTAKRRAALAIALADISGAWPLHEVTDGLTRFADASVGAALRFLLIQKAADISMAELSPEQLEGQTGLVVLAMGKHGARELNYSS